MKKIILVALIIGSLLSCKEEKPKTDGVVNTSDANTKKDVNLMPACGHDTIVIIDKKEINNINYWYETIKNKNFVCSENLDVYCFDNYVIDLTKIANQDALKPYDEEKVAKWLKINAENICYEATYPYIEKSHIISKKEYQDEIDLLISEKKCTSYTINELIAKLSDFEKINYEKYAEMSIDGSNNIVFNMIDDYKTGMDCYSLPFFKSIIHVNKIKKSEYDDYKLEFVKVDFSTHGKGYAFRLSKKDNSVVGYYNYSTNPGKVGSVKIRNAFI